MTAKAFIAAAMLLAFHAPMAVRAQTQPANPDKTVDVAQPNRFWQASVGGGHYMVALDRISAISRHKYVLNGNLLVDEVTVDALGQSLVRFYHISPLTDALGASATANAAARVVERGRELVEKAAETVGTGAHNMVVKNYPDTTHARTIEYRVLSETELGALYNSVRTAWETGKGRRFGIK